MTDSSDSSKRKKLGEVISQSSQTNPVKIRSHHSTLQSSWNEKIEGQTRRKSKKLKGKKKVELPINVSSSNSEIGESPLPQDNFYDENSSSTADICDENIIAFKDCRSPEDIKKRKRKTKKKSYHNRRQYSKVSSHGIEDSDSEFEPLADKLERLPSLNYVDNSSSDENDKEEHSDSFNVTIHNHNDNEKDEHGFEKKPGCTEYYLRTLNPLHNKFEVTSRGVQTDWSWLKDANNEVNGTDMKEILESVESDFSPQNSGISVRGKKECHDKTTKATGELPKKKDKTEKLTAKKNKKNIRVVKSAVYSQDENHVKGKIRKAYSENAIKCSHDGKIDDSNTDDDNGNLEQPAILKYRRERTIDDEQLSGTVCTNSHIVSDHSSDEELPTHGLFSGPCQFCCKPILTVPLEEEIKDAPLDQVFCCPEYEHFIKLQMTSLEKEYGSATELIDITPHAPFGEKKIQKVNKEKVTERTKEREIDRQKWTPQSNNVYTFSRQVKTIQFSLTSAKCMQDGWAVKPQTPTPEIPSIDSEIFQVEVNSTQLQKAEILNEKCYENGKKFLTIFPDGTGCCYYPDGNVAVMITSVEKEKYTYIVFSDENYDDVKGDGILAIFEPFGNVICYYKNRKIRLFLNAHGGIELDRYGQRKKRWQWYFVKGHVHVPPFQPLCFPLNKSISVRLLDQHNIALIFTARRRTVRFNVGSNLTAHGIEGHGRFEPDSSEDYLLTKKKELSSIITKIHSVLRLPKSSFQQTSRSFKKSSARDILPPISSEPSVIVT